MFCLLVAVCAAFVVAIPVQCSNHSEFDDDFEVMTIRAALMLEQRNTSIYDEIHFRPAFHIAQQGATKRICVQHIVHISFHK